MPKFISVNNLADILGTSLATAQKWGENGVYPYHTNEYGKKGFFMEDLLNVMFLNKLQEEWLWKMLLIMLMKLLALMLL